MNKLLIFLGFLVSLSIPLLNADEDFPDTFDIFTELDDFDAEDDEFEAFESARASKNLVNVDAFGAVGDGISDDTQAFVNAWKQACSTRKSVLLVPEGRRYLVGATRFKGPCVDKLVIQINGLILAPGDPKTWDPNNPRNWIVFNNLTKVLFQGQGGFDGSGSKWWASSCKKNKSNPCKPAPTALTIDSSSAVRVKGLTIQNAQQMHVVFSHCNAVRVLDVKVSAPGDSPNTDGIHITASTNVVLQNCKIGTGDDCISIVNASSVIKMKNINCGPGHGISIGSLGKDNSTGIVEKVVLDKALIQGTTNGLRIKTWQGGNGHVKGVRFQNVQMVGVSNPIIIDQFYCDSPTACKIQTSAVAISQIMYRNISGTTKGEKAMNFACSDTVPCTNIFLNNINLRSDDVSGSVETYCHSATGICRGDIQPSAECLISSSHHNNTKDDKIISIHNKEEDADTSTEQHHIHTEL